MTQSVKAGDLHRIVESAFLAHKKDIHDYASGHLNPDKLVKLPTKQQLATHVPWKSSRHEERRENAYDRITQTRNAADDILIDRLGLMKNALLDFSVGTTGTLPKINPKKPRKKLKKRRATPKVIPSPLHSTKSEAKLESSVLYEIEKLMNEQPDVFMPPKKTSQQGKEESKVAPQKTPRKKYVLHYATNFPRILTEELKLQEVMLPSVDEAARVPPSLKDPYPSIKQKVQEMTDKKFITTHLAGITRRDRFNKILDFDRNVLHRYETMEKKVRDGHRAAAHLEQKLVRRLLEINDQNGQAFSVNFERLQAYGEVWQDLCSDSTIFGPLLSEIKSEFDDYLSNLLDIMKATNHAELLTCLNAADGLTQYTEADIEEKRHLIEEMEEEGRNGLLRNAELHKLIAQEKEIIEEKRKQQEQEEEENQRRLVPIKQTSKKSETRKSTPLVLEKKEKNTNKQLQELRAEIWERLDQISSTQNELKTDYVPKTLHRNVQHAVQDTESEMQKLIQQHEYFTKNMKIQEDSLESDLTRFDSLTNDEMTDLFSNLGIP